MSSVYVEFRWKDSKNYYISTTSEYILIKSVKVNKITKFKEKERNQFLQALLKKSEPVTHDIIMEIAMKFNVFWRNYAMLIKDSKVSWADFWIT